LAGLHKLLDGEELPEEEVTQILSALHREQVLVVSKAVPVVVAAVELRLELLALDTQEGRLPEHWLVAVLRDLVQQQRLALAAMAPRVLAVKVAVVAVVAAQPQALVVQVAQEANLLAAAVVVAVQLTAPTLVLAALAALA
jgi:hypothetical protein